MVMQGKRILLGVTGSIAAYKVASLVRLLVQQGAEVQVVMTEDAKAFITPLTLATLSKRPVLSTYFDPLSGEWNNHVDWGLWADYLLIAPLTANTLSKMAHGQCDSFLLGTYLSARCPVWVAPAMDLDMWDHPATQHNIQLLALHGVKIIPPGVGELASGLFGKGRMAEPEQMVDLLLKDTQSTLPLKGKKAMVTAGPTYEAIDPVRFIGNHSSGKMGFALAKRLKDLGAEVTLIHGPTALLPLEGITSIAIISAKDLLEVCLEHAPASDIIIMSAAVADYRPKVVYSEKVKKSAEEWAIELEKTQDILGTLGTQKRPHQTLVGFALETQNELVHAQDKLSRKNLDYIVLNSMRDPGAGFAVDTNKVSLIGPSGVIWQSDLATKEQIAEQLIDHLVPSFLSAS
jgi:phosphopantothenoylcysteine decarboxylase/phosphopantothenate--cysteine ligase